MDTAQEIVALRNRGAALVAEAKGLRDSFKDDLPENVQEKIDKLHTEAFSVKTQLENAEKQGQLESFWNDPKDGAGSVRTDWKSPAETDQREIKYDEKSFVPIQTLYGEVKYHLPRAILVKGYEPAFRAYLSKGNIEYLGPTDQKALSEGKDPDGGYLVPPDYQSELIKKMATMATVRQLAEIITTNRDLIRYPKVNYATDDKYTSPIRLKWSGESPATASAIRASNPVYGQVNIPVHTAMASVPVSNDLIEDAQFPVLDMISGLLAEAFALGENDAFLNGDGTAQPMGILAQVGQTDGSSNKLGPAIVKSGTSASLTTSSDAHSGYRLNQLFLALPPQYQTQPGVAWIMNLATQGAIEDLVDGQKRPIAQALMVGSMETPLVTTIRGKKVVVDQFMPDIGASTFPILFGDFSGYTIVDRVGFSVQRLTEIYAETNLTVLLARKRVGGYITEPWQLYAFECAA